MPSAGDPTTEELGTTGTVGIRGEERGFTLVESLIAAAVVAVGAGALIAAMGGFARFSTQQQGPVRTAALLLAEQTLRVAQDAWKYGSPGSAPSGSVQTALPLKPANGPPTTAPASVSATFSGDGQAGRIDVTVRYTPDPFHADPGIVTLSGAVRVQAPLPGSAVQASSPIPAPTGAP